MSTAYQVPGIEKKPSLRNPAPKRGQIKTKILTKVFSAIRRGSRKDNEKEENDLDAETLPYNIPIQGSSQALRIQF